MVRIKHRYLLVHILYPSAPSTTAIVPSKPAPSTSHTSPHPAQDDLPWPVQFHRPTPSGITSQLLLRTIRNQIQFLFGDWGAGVTSASLAVKYLSLSTSTFILRVAREHYRIVGAALVWLTELPSDKVPDTKKARTECVFRVVRVSGTIRKSEEEALRRAREVVWRLKDLGGRGEGSAAETTKAGEGLDGLAEGVRRDQSSQDGESDEEDKDEDDDGDG